MFRHRNIGQFLRAHWILISVLFLSVMLSSYRMSDCQITMDEFFSINIAQHSISEMWGPDPHPGLFYSNRFPPLYATLLHPVWLLSKESLFWSRLLSISFNVAALITIFLIAKLLFDKGAGLIAVAFASLNYAYLIFSKMIRCYSFLNLLSLASFYIFFRMAKGKLLDKKSLVSLLLVNVAILYTFYFGGFVIFIELILSCLFFSKRALFKMWLWLLGSFIFLLPWSGHFLEDLSTEPAIHFKISNMHHFLDVLAVRFKEGIFHNQALLIFYSAICIYFLVIMIYLLYKKDKQAPFIASLLIILLFSALTINYLTAEVYRESRLTALTEPTRARYSFPFIFPIFILTGLFIRKLPRYMGITVFLALAFFSLSTAKSYFREPAQKFWPAQLAPIANEAKAFRVPPNDKVIIEVEDSLFVPVFVYYFYGPPYFRGASIPYQGANIKQLNRTLGSNYKTTFNGMKQFPLFKSVDHLAKFDWLFLIYSDWLKTQWGDHYRTIYDEKLKEKGMLGKIILVNKSTVGQFTLEIYKIKK